MKKASIRIALLTLLVVALATGGASAFYGIIVAGVTPHDGKIDPYFYVEGTIMDTVSIGVGGFHDVIGASVWLGEWGGAYGEVMWQGGLGSSPASIEAGLWRGFQPSSGLILYGWAGGNYALDGSSTLGISLGAEAQIALSGPLSIVIGGGTQIKPASGGANAASGYAGLGYSF